MRRHGLKKERHLHRLGGRSATRNSAGFTLVEMLVSVALVVIMMSMFATIFQLASGSMLTQRGIAENDQRARSVVTVIRKELEARSFKNLVPFLPAEDPSTSPVSFADRKGYFYISENNPNDQTDDVLQFTVELPDTGNELYFGRASALYPLSSTGTQYFGSNEPERDDLNTSADGSSHSYAAEVAIFMRGGRLYRRVLLLRDPYEDPNYDLTKIVQPSDFDQNYFDPNNDGTGGTPNEYTGNFWNDFDFSAHFGLTTGNVSTGAEFHGAGELDNTTATAVPFGDVQNVVKVPAVPRFRFGHNQIGGLPREYVGTVGGGTNDQFIGRFTHEETSFGFFQYPHKLSQDGSGNQINDGNPMEQNPGTRQLNLVGAVVTDDTNVVFSGPRRAEDLLLPNVHAFDVKVWDERLRQFVDIGHNLVDGGGNDGDYHRNNNQRPAYGPNGPSGNNVFDTWHWQFDFDNADGDDDDETEPDPPPYRPEDASTIPKPLRAIQITIRYYDVSSAQLRQVTQQISLTD